MKINKTICAVVAAAFLAGCATAPPNTPGAGRGEAYTPIVDMQGVDMSRYQRDLADCRKYAGIIDREANMWGGALAGVIVGGVLAAALGGNSRTIDQSASMGGLAGMTQAETQSAGKQQRILINCMAGRGYRTLDGTVAPVVVQGGQQSPYTNSNAQPAAPQQAVAAAQVVPASQPSVAPVVGKDAYQAEQVARDLQCAPHPVASMVHKGPGFENYTVNCSNGDSIMLRCEFGICRALK